MSSVASAPQSHSRHKAIFHSAVCGTKAFRPPRVFRCVRRRMSESAAVCVHVVIRSLARISIGAWTCIRTLMFARSSWSKEFYLHGSVTFVWNWNIWLIHSVRRPLALVPSAYLHRWTSVCVSVCSDELERICVCGTSWWPFLISGTASCVCTFLCQHTWTHLGRAAQQTSNKVAFYRRRHTFHRILIATFSH